MTRTPPSESEPNERTVGVHGIGIQHPRRQSLGLQPRREHLRIDGIEVARAQAQGTMPRCHLCTLGVTHRSACCQRKAPARGFRQAISRASSVRSVRATLEQFLIRQPAELRFELFAVDVHAELSERVDAVLQIAQQIFRGFDADRQP